MFGPGRASARKSGFPLTMAREGDQLQVVDIRGGRGMRQHLIDMGLVPGAQVTVMNGPGRGIIARVLDSKIALAPGMARRVMVRPLQ